MASLNTLSRAVLAVDILSRLDNGWHDNRDGMNLKQVQINSFQEKANACENFSI